MGFSPLDNELGIWDGSWSEGVVKLAVWVAGRHSYREAEETLSRVGGFWMSANRIWHYTNQWAERLCERQDQEVEQANAVPRRDEPQRGEARHDRPMGFSLDGWMVNIVGEGWKEVKSGVIYEVGVKVGRDELTGEALELPQARQGTYIAHLGGPEDFGRKFWAEALRRDLPAAYDKACVSDGAQWLWNLCQDYVPEATQIVDWYHACQHLHTAANLLYGEGTDPARCWAEATQTDLYQGHAARLADQLATQAHSYAGDRAELLRAEATFFHNQQRRMQYLEYRENGWPIGSGSIESGAKQFQSRLTGPGMRWSRPGADRMLALRCSIMNHSFDRHWLALSNSPPI